MPEGSRTGRGSAIGVTCWLLLLSPGCASMRYRATDADLRPCTDGFAATDDGWELGVRRFEPTVPDPGKLPVVLCHGMGLNGTFWTISPSGKHLPAQLAARGYRVYVVDMRGSGSSHRVGPIGRINRALRQTPFNEMQEARWTMDDQVHHDVPAILDYIQGETGSGRVNWVGHSLGGMLMLAHLETTDRPERIANLVNMGGVAIITPSRTRTEMLKANRALRVLATVVSTGRIARPLQWLRLPGVNKIDRFYYTMANVDPLTVSRFYGSTLENPGRGTLLQLDSYLATGHMRSADGRVDYAEHLGRVTTPTLMVAGEADVMADIPSSMATFDALGSPDKSLLRFGTRDGHVDDYGHCDLVWSRHAPDEIFPPLIDWLDRRQPATSAAFGFYDRPRPGPPGTTPR